MAEEAGGSTGAEGGDPQATAGADGQFDGQDQPQDRGARLDDGGDEASKPRRIKPIPPHKGSGELPGVHPRGAEDFVDMLGRDERGRFTKKAESTPFEGEGGDRPADGPDDKGDVAAKKPEAAPADPSVKPPAAPSGEITFLGKKTTVAAVEQTHKSLQGQFRSLTDERNYGYQQANGWKDAHDRVKAELDAIKASQPGGGAVQGKAGAVPQGSNAQPAASGLNVDGILEDIDTDAFETVVAEGGLPAAAKFIAGETLKAVLEKVVPQIRSELQGEFNNRLQPFESREQESQQESSASQLIKSVGSLVTHSGEPAFPELSDPEAVPEIGRIWREAGLPPDMVLSPQGLIMAVSLYRTYKGLPEPGAQPASTTPSTPKARTAPAPGSAASLPDTGASRPPSSGRANLDPKMAELLSGFNTEDLLVESQLGFRRNRRPSNFSE
jgi:hypothetical protein